MKKILSLLFVSLFVSSGYAAVIPPADARGNSLFNPDFVGVQATSIDNSTGTNIIIINSTGTGGASIGGAIVYGIITSSIAPTDYLVFKDSTGFGTNGQIAGQTGLGSFQSMGATMAVISNTYQQGVTTNTSGQAFLGYENYIPFVRPIQFPNGIVAGVSASPTSNGGLSRWTILWRPLYSTSLKSGQ